MKKPVSRPGARFSGMVGITLAFLFLFSATDSWACTSGQCTLSGRCYNSGTQVQIRICFNGVWKWTNGHACSSGSDCASGNCNNGYCCDSGACGRSGRCFANGALVTGDECVNGVWKVANGGSCSANSVCASGNCVAGYCCDTGGCGKAGRCYANGANVQGDVCVNGVWKVAKSGSCSANSECASGNCNNGYCCDGGECGKAGRCYTSGTQVLTDVCINGVWKTANSHSCSSGSECASGNCNNGYCCNTGDCGVSGRCIAPGAVFGGYICCNKQLKPAYSGNVRIDCLDCTHIWSMGSVTPTYSLGFNPAEKNIVDGYYVICPGTTVSVTGTGTYNKYCSNGVVYSSQANFVSWTYDANNVRLALRYTNLGISSSLDRGSVIGSSSQLAGIALDSSTPTNDIYTFTNPSSYKVNLDVLNAYCDSPDTVSCPYLGGAWRSDYCRYGYINTVAEAEGWLELNGYNILVPSPALSVTPPAGLNLTQGSSANLVWTVQNTGVGKIDIFFARQCADWTCSFIGYTEGTKVTLVQGQSYTLVMRAVAGAFSRNVGISATYDDGYGLTCIPPRTVQSMILINVPGSPVPSTTTTTTTISSTTTTNPPAITTTTTTTIGSTTTTTFVAPGTKTVTLKYKLSYPDPETLFNCTISTNISGSETRSQNQVKSSPNNKYLTIMHVPSGMYRWTVNCSDGVHNVYPLADNAPRGAPEGYWIFYVTA